MKGKDKCRYTGMPILGVLHAQTPRQHARKRKAKPHRSITNIVNSTAGWPRGSSSGGARMNTDRNSTTKSPRHSTANMTESSTLMPSDTVHQSQKNTSARVTQPSQPSLRVTNANEEKQVL